MTADQNTENKILNSALNVFVEKGRYGAKMQEIADGAGINKALLHYYFRSKENLYAKIFEMVFKRFFTRFDQVIHTDMPFDQLLKVFIGSYLDILSQNRHIPLFLARELSEGGETVSRIVSRFVQDENIKFPKILIGAIEKAAERGEIRPVDPKQFIMTLIGSSIFYFVAKPVILTFLNENDDLNRKEFIEERKDAIFDVLYHGIKPRGESE